MRESEKISSLIQIFNLASELSSPTSFATANVRCLHRRPPPSSATFSSGEPRVGCALKSATFSWKSRRHRLALILACEVHVPLSSHRELTGLVLAASPSSPEQVSGLVFRFWRVLVLALVFFSSFSLGFSFFDQK